MDQRPDVDCPFVLNIAPLTEACGSTVDKLIPDIVLVGPGSNNSNKPLAIVMAPTRLANTIKVLRSGTIIKGSRNPKWLASRANRGGPVLTPLTNFYIGRRPRSTFNLVINSNRQEIHNAKNAMVDKSMQNILRRLQLRSKGRKRSRNAGCWPP